MASPEASKKASLEAAPMAALSPIDYRDIPPGDNLLQSRFWGDFKSRFGWKPRGFLYEGRGILLLERRLPGGYFLAYLPHPLKNLSPAGLSAPQAAERAAAQDSTRAAAPEFFGEMKTFLPRKTLCIRADLSRELDLKGGGSADETKVFKDFGDMKKAVTDVQPPSTVIVSLEGTEEDLLKAMKSKTRYNIRLAFRRGVEVRRENPDFLPKWYDLYLETARRDRIAIHSREYYRGLFETAAALDHDASGKDAGVGDVPDLRIYSAYHEGDLLASVITAFYGGNATYLYGASSNEKRNLMASYAVQWEAMKAAAAAGCSSYDLFGIPPADDPAHPMHGLYRFKTGFGGRIVHRPGAWDLPVSRGAYALFRLIEQARYYYFKKLKKR